LNNLEKNYYQAPQAGTADREYLARLLGADYRERSRDKNHPQIQLSACGQRANSRPE
jgi:hypothetical protein